MAQRISDVLKIDPKLLKKERAFDGFVDIDSKFYIDPRLLDITRTPELKNSRNTFENYFKNVFTLLQNSKNDQDRFWRETYKRLHFKEIRLIGLGYSKSSNYGNAIGNIYANILIKTSRELIDVGIKDPTIFELLGLFEEGIGADRISDLTAIIILEHLLKYSVRVCSNLKIKDVINTNLNGKKYSLPRNPISNKPIIFLPKEILTPLPVAHSWSEIDIVCAKNEALRQKVNEIVGNTWKKATNQNKIKKSTLRRILFSEPELLKDLLEVYKQKPKQKYDFENDPLGEIIWADISKEYSSKYPLNLKQYVNLSPQNLFSLVKSICDHFGELIEDNGLNELLWDKNKLKHERFSQKLFYGIADAYCRANNLDLSPETNSGRGPVDFKISQGYSARVLVEVKYSSSSALVRGYNKQLPIYAQAEKTFDNIYLVLKTTNSEQTIKTISKLREKQISDKKRAPEIMIVDARKKISASKVR